MINWQKYFDHIYCICNIGTNRFEKINSELNRIGILDSNIFSWKITTNKLLSYIDYDLKYNDEKYDNNIIVKNKSIDLVKTNLDIFTEAKLLNYNKILVIEDDACFLKDIDEIERILNNLPEEYDICHFDWIYPFVNYNENIITQIENRYVNNDYIYSIGSYLATCNAYSQIFIDYILDNIDNMLSKNICMPMDDLILNIIQLYRIIISNEYLYFSYEINAYTQILINIISVKRLCIQSQNFNSLNNELNFNNFYKNKNNPNPIQKILDQNFIFNNYNI